MNNNQTIDGVPRESLELALGFLDGYGHEDYQRVIADELRALLDVPAEPFSHDGWSIDHSAGRPILVHNNCSVIEAEQAYGLLELIKAAAQPHGEPVERTPYDDDDAQAAFEVLNRMPRHVTKFKGGYAATEFNAWDAHEFCKKWDGFKQCAKLYAEQPAPVAVILDERQSFANWMHERVNECVTLHESGMRDVHIAEKLGVSRGTVHRRLKAHYGERPRGGAPRQIKDEYLKEIVERRRAGKTLVTVEAEMGFSVRAMQRALGHFNLRDEAKP